MCEYPHRHLEAGIQDLCLDPWSESSHGYMRLSCRFSLADLNERRQLPDRQRAFPTCVALRSSALE